MSLLEICWSFLFIDLFLKLFFETNFLFIGESSNTFLFYFFLCELDCDIISHQDLVFVSVSPYILTYLL